MVFEKCALVTPWISEAGGEVVLTHYYAPCKTVDFLNQRWWRAHTYTTALGLELG